MPFVIGRGFAEAQIQEMALSWIFWIILINFAYTLLFTRSGYMNWQMPFFISRCYAELQILTSRGYAEV